MKLYFLRHGIAAERDEWAGDDFDRPLTAEGCERMSRQAKAMAKLSLAPDVILTSPFVRAKQTAQIVAGKLKPRDGVVEDARLGAEFDSSRLADILADYGRYGAVMLVGHEPSFSDAIGRLIGRAELEVKKGGLACVETAAEARPAGKLLWLVPPRILLL